MSMRAVAERVGLTSMALYPYVGGKDALLDGLVDLLHLELGTAVGTNLGDIDWRQRLRALGRAVRGLAHAHPGAFPLLLNRAGTGPSAFWLTAALRGILHDAGVPHDRVSGLARMICAFLLGYTTGEVTGGLPAPPVDGQPAEVPPPPNPGAEPTRGGQQNATPGAEPTRGGKQNPTPGAEPTRGGQQNATPGAEPTRGGKQNATPGAEPTRGGQQNATPGAEPTRG